MTASQGDGAGVERLRAALAEAEAYIRDLGHEIGDDGYFVDDKAPEEVASRYRALLATLPTEPGEAKTEQPQAVVGEPITAGEIELLRQLSANASGAEGEIDPQGPSFSDPVQARSYRAAMNRARAAWKAFDAKCDELIGRLAPADGGTGT